MSAKIIKPSDVTKSIKEAIALLKKADSAKSMGAKLKPLENATSQAAKALRNATILAEPVPPGPL